MYMLYILFPDIDECLSEPCPNGGTCLDEVNGYTCTCVPWYTGGHCETGKADTQACIVRQVRLVQCGAL